MSALGTTAVFGTMSVDVASRLRDLPPYLFVEVDRKKREAIAKGVDIINLGIGDPDIPTPRFIVRELQRASAKAANHRYPESEGLFEFRAAVTEWYRRRFDVSLDPMKEVITLIGAKEGIGHLPLALADPGDVVLVPDPAYPVYLAGTIFAGAKPHLMPLLEERGFLPDFDAIPIDVAQRAKLLFLNYPNNPTGAVATLDFYARAIDFARRNNIVIAADSTYSEISFNGYKPPSFLEAEGAIDVGVEFHSLSKTFNMTGWRLGFVVGHPVVVDSLRAVKANLDSGAFQAVQEAGIAALSRADAVAAKNSRVYRRRRDVLVKALRRAGLSVKVPVASFYVWAQVPTGHTSTSFTSLLIDRCGIVCTPGNGFGKYGEGFVRFALTAPVGRLEEAARRMEGALALRPTDYVSISSTTA